MIFAQNGKISIRFIWVRYREQLLRQKCLWQLLFYCVCLVTLISYILLNRNKYTICDLVYNMTQIYIFVVQSIKRIFYKTQLNIRTCACSHECADARGGGTYNESRIQ